MAGKARRKCEYSEKDTMFVGRFVYDVLVYTLSKCGFPQDNIPTLDCKENVYQRANFIKIAGASSLRISLLLREKWRQMFIKQRNSFASNSEEVSIFLGRLGDGCSLSRTRTVQSTVEVFLASCNEVLLFLHHEGIEIDAIKVMKSISSYILLITGPSQNISEKIEGLFDDFDNISGYSRWITNFIKKYAIPYGSRDDISNLFLERVRQQFINLKKENPSGTPSINLLKDHLGYLPKEFISAIAGEESASLPENVMSASAPIPPVDCKSKESVCVKITLHGRRLTGSEGVSEPTVKVTQSSKNSLELGIEDDLEKMNLKTVGDSQTSHNAIPKQKTPRKKGGKK